MDMTAYETDIERINYHVDVNVQELIQKIKYIGSCNDTLVF